MDGARLVDRPVVDAVSGIGTATPEAALRTVLDRHPTAWVAAIRGEERPEPIDVPAGLVLADHRRVRPQPLLELVVPEDRPAVMKLWALARTRGTSIAPISLLGLGTERLRRGQLCLFDLRREHGAIIAVFVDAADGTIEPALVAVAAVPAFPPRFARARKDIGAVFVDVDPALSEILGWSAEELIGRRTTEFVHPDDREAAIANWMQMLDSPGPGPRTRVRHRHREGSWVWLEVTNHNRLSDPEFGDVLAEMVDISDEMAAHEALRAREQLLAQLTETVPVGLFHADLRGDLLFTNRRLHQITGTSIASTIDDQLAGLPADDRSRARAALGAAARGVDADVELTVRRDGAAPTHCALSVRPLRDETGTVIGLTGWVEDITHRVHARRELEARAERDPLTGCLNRAAAVTTLQKFLDGQTAGSSGVAVVFVDLDRLKPVNDSYGHAAGDELLVRVVDRLRSSVGAEGVVGRLGGDEFLVIRPGVPTRAEAAEIATRLATRVVGPLELAESTVQVRASFGVAWTEQPGMNAGQMLHAADRAMYVSKRDGRCEPVMAPSVGAS